ncbi:MAG: ATPase [Clostridium sp.]|nr:ATPase [Clostridium sp.]
MAKEALESIKKAEEEAFKIIENAKEKASEVRKNSYKEADLKYKEVINSANEKAQEIYLAAKLSGEKSAKPILAKGMAERDKLKSLKDDDLTDAISIVTERIVNTNGNS